MEIYDKLKEPGVYIIEKSPNPNNNILIFNVKDIYLHPINNTYISIQGDTYSTYRTNGESLSIHIPDNISNIQINISAEDHVSIDKNITLNNNNITVETILMPSNVEYSIFPVDQIDPIWNTTHAKVERVEQNLLHVISSYASYRITDEAVEHIKKVNTKTRLKLIKWLQYSKDAEVHLEQVKSYVSTPDMTNANRMVELLDILIDNDGLNVKQGTDDDFIFNILIKTESEDLESLIPIVEMAKLQGWISYSYNSDYGVLQCNLEDISKEYANVSPSLKNDVQSAICSLAGNVLTPMEDITLSIFRTEEREPLTVPVSAGDKVFIVGKTDREKPIY